MIPIGEHFILRRQKSTPALDEIYARKTVVARNLLCRSEEHTSELSHVSISYAVFCLKKKKLVILVFHCRRLINGSVLILFATYELQLQLCPRSYNHVRCFDSLAYQCLWILLKR